MKRPTLFGGIVFAFLSAVFAAPLWWGLSLVFPFGTALRLVAAAASFAYLVYLVRARRSRIGTVTQVARQPHSGSRTVHFPGQHERGCLLSDPPPCPQPRTALPEKPVLGCPGWPCGPGRLDVCRLSGQHNRQHSHGHLGLFAHTGAVRPDSAESRLLSGIGKIGRRRPVCAQSAPGGGGPGKIDPALRRFQVSSKLHDSCNPGALQYGQNTRSRRS